LPSKIVCVAWLVPSPGPPAKKFCPPLMLVEMATVGNGMLGSVGIGATI